MVSRDLTDGQQLLAAVGLTRSVSVLWAVVSIGGFVISAYGFGLVLAIFRGDSLEPITITPPSPTGLLVLTAIGLGAVCLVVICHELIHGLCLAHYGADPEYGIGLTYFILPVAYTATAGTAYSRNQLLVVLLAPLAVITTVGLAALVLLPTPLLVVGLAANVAGSIGDCWMAILLLRYPPQVRVAALPADDGYGIGIYGTDADRRPTRSLATRSIAAFVFGTSGTVTLLVVVGLVSLFTSLILGSGTVTLGNPDGIWFLFRHQLDDHGAVIEFGSVLVLICSVLGGSVAALLTLIFER